MLCQYQNEQIFLNEAMTFFQRRTQWLNFRDKLSLIKLRCFLHSVFSGYTVRD